MSDHIKLKAGDTATWTSQAQGSFTEKIGEVVAVVPAYTDIRKHLPENFRVTCRLMFDTLYAGHDRYLVKVPGGKTDKAKPKFYAPNVSVVDRGV